MYVDHAQTTSPTPHDTWTLTPILPLPRNPNRSEDRYTRWFDSFSADIPIKALILLTTGSEMSHSRIASRGRCGEETIPIEYIVSLGKQHEKWADTTNLPVLRVSTETSESTAAAVTEISSFIDRLVAADATAAAASGGDLLAVTQKFDAVRVGSPTIGGSPVSAHTKHAVQHTAEGATG